MTLGRRFIMPLAIAGALALGGPVLAQDADAFRDEVILDLTEETWVDATDARLVIEIETAVAAGAFDAARQRIRDSLERIDETAQWRTTQFSRNPDPTGLERWFVVSEARVAAGAVGDVRGKAEAASEAGFKVRVGLIDFSPSPAAYEAARADLRLRLYRAVRAELERLNGVFGDAGFHVAEIDFVGRPVLPGQGQRRLMRAAPAQFDGAQPVAAESGGAAEMAVSRRLTLSTTVVLAAE